ncbi:MAG: hypothetical protein WBD27_08955 [Pyrinomonadaceae bacterium]
MEEFAKTYVPLISALISLVSVLIAFFALWWARKDRREQQKAADADANRREKIAEADAHRREQEALLAALQGEKESVGFMALELLRNQSLITDANRDRIFTVLCLAFVFDSSSRVRALVSKTLKKFSADTKAKPIIIENLLNLEKDFEIYEKEIGEKELTKYIDRIKLLKNRLDTNDDVG